VVLGRLRFSLAALERGTVLLAVVLASACQAPVSSGSPLHIVNVDGPAVTVSINGGQVTRVGCGSSATVTPTGSPPWVVVVIAESGSDLYRTTLVDAAEQGIVVRLDGVRSGAWPMPYGPAGACPSAAT
jgi:hypothetical protein